MKKIIKLTETELKSLIKEIINEGKVCNSPFAISMQNPYEFIIDDEKYVIMLLRCSKLVKYDNHYQITEIKGQYSVEDDLVVFETNCVNEYGSIYGNNDLWKCKLSDVPNKLHRLLLDGAFDPYYMTW